MKIERNILVAFLLNLVFSVVEWIGGALTGSVAIMSDSVHDFGDALSIGVAYLLERKSHKHPDAKYTYGYTRYSVLGAAITALILLIGSGFVIVTSVVRLFEPTKIDYSGMIGLAIFGVIVNVVATYITSRGESLNQRSVNLHMLEDVLGWIAVLFGAILMKLTGWNWIDPVLSLGVAVFILVEVCKNLLSVLDLLLVRTPRGLDVAELKKKLEEIKGVKNVHHLHVWSLDGTSYYATLHAQASDKAKTAIREVLAEEKIKHVTIEMEKPGEKCQEEECEVPQVEGNIAGHHHHH